MGDLEDEALRSAGPVRITFEKPTSQGGNRYAWKLTVTGDKKANSRPWSLAPRLLTDSIRLSSDTISPPPLQYSSRTSSSL